MRPITLVLIIHDHQPVGNFDGVFRQAYLDAYQPFLHFLETRPPLRLALHTSGPLLQWLALHEPSYLTRLAALVGRGQVELWGGGFFEPVLPAIPEVDREGQIRAMADWLELELGRRPSGLWLTERVWEPGLASSLAAAGVAYTAVDDAHFVAAGFERDALWGTYLTEDQGRALRIFPIHRELRYLVPFEEPQRTVDLLARVAEGGEGRIAVLGDDGEKFGVWPGTRALCYEQRWLERWADALEANPWIRLATPAEAVAHHPPLGLAYLPSASYHEMQEWALPPAAQARVHRVAELLAEEFGDAAHDLVRGGHWRNFLTRYPESNRMHKRMLRASRRIASAHGPEDAERHSARTHLWRSQCNCPYWHGVFGGLYLPHLRSAVYHELIAAESFRAPERPSVERFDLDLDGIDDALLETSAWAAWISARGARLWGFDDRGARINYGDTLARRPELYHERLAQARAGAGERHTIHGDLRLKDPALAGITLEYDPRGRDSFIDRWIETGSDHDWALDRFRLEESSIETAVDEGAGSAVLAGVEVEGVTAHRAGTRRGRDVSGSAAGAAPAHSASAPIVSLVVDESVAPALEKRYRPGADGGLEVEYVLRSSRARRGMLVVELNLGLHVPEADDRYVEIEGRRADPPHFAARARHEAVTRAAYVDRWADRRLEVRTEPAATLARAPIETVSLSEDGAERVFQGLETRYEFPVSLEAGGSFHARFRLVPGRASVVPERS